MNKLLNTSVLRFSYDIMHTLELSAILNVMQPPVARETFAFGGGSWRLVVDQKNLVVIALVASRTVACNFSFQGKQGLPSHI